MSRSWQVAIGAALIVGIILFLVLCVVPTLNP